MSSTTLLIECLPSGTKPNTVHAQFQHQEQPHPAITNIYTHASYPNKAWVVFASATSPGIHSSRRLFGEVGGQTYYCRSISPGEIPFDTTVPCAKVSRYSAFVAEKEREVKTSTLLITGLSSKLQWRQHLAELSGVDKEDCDGKFVYVGEKTDRVGREMIRDVKVQFFDIKDAEDVWEEIRDKGMHKNQVVGEVEVMDVDRETETEAIEAGGIEADGSSGPVRNSRSPLPMEVTPIARRPTPEPINDFVPLGAAGDIQEPAAAQSVPASEPAVGEAESYSIQKGHGNIAEAIGEIAPLTEEQKTARPVAQAQQGNEEQANNEQPAVGASGATMPTPAGNAAQNATASDDPGVFARTPAIKPRKQRRAPNKPTGVEKSKSRGKTASADPSRLVLRVPRAALESLDNPVPRFQPFGRARGPALAPPQPQPQQQSQLQPQLGPVLVPVPQPRARVPARPSSHHPLSALQRETLQAQSDVLDRSIMRAAAQSVLRAREKDEIDRQIEQWMRDKEEIDRQLE
ncbi:hypothetical protein E8E13_000997 [Curvularia kusanoi]|uniref:Uncharacterized protein n=1 Tax=Curvularia kusanoi TaxID=90978 RepID=A0A9P4T3V3_CURKU|nr:hypothetical protein E8E13_000997 [Curvularia kusanoi]